MSLLAGQNEESEFRIRFDLDDLETVRPWGRPGECELHWYGLTSGRFWIETVVGNPFEYTTAVQNHWKSPVRVPDYFVARFFEDLLDFLPDVLEPIPEDMAARVSNRSWRIKAEQWRDSIESELHWDQWYAATEWWHHRSLDMGYLSHAPRSTFWRVQNVVYFQWNADGKEENIPVWASPEGQISMSVSDFESSVRNFGEELLGAMGERVHKVQKHGWQRTDCTVDVNGLVAEQTKRRESFERRLVEKRATDWRQKRVCFDILLALMGEQMTERT